MVDPRIFFPHRPSILYPPCRFLANLYRDKPQPSPPLPFLFLAGRSAFAFFLVFLAGEFFFSFRNPEGLPDLAILSRTFFFHILGDDLLGGGFPRTSCELKSLRYPFFFWITLVCFSPKTFSIFSKSAFPRLALERGDCLNQFRPPFGNYNTVFFPDPFQ